jgi:hypothetical protein
MDSRDFLGGVLTSHEFAIIIISFVVGTTVQEVGAGGAMERRYAGLGGSAGGRQGLPRATDVSGVPYVLARRPGSFPTL